MEITNEGDFMDRSEKFSKKSKEFFGYIINIDYAYIPEFNCILLVVYLSGDILFLPDF